MTEVEFAEPTCHILFLTRHLTDRLHGRRAQCPSATPRSARRRASPTSSQARPRFPRPRNPQGNGAARTGPPDRSPAGGRRAGGLCLLRVADRCHEACRDPPEVPDAAGTAPCHRPTRPLPAASLRLRAEDYETDLETEFQGRSPRSRRMPQVFAGAVSIIYNSASVESLVLSRQAVNAIFVGTLTSWCPPRCPARALSPKKTVSRPPEATPHRTPLKTVPDCHCPPPLRRAS